MSAFMKPMTAGEKIVNFWRASDTTANIVADQLVYARWREWRTGFFGINRLKLRNLIAEEMKQHAQTTLLRFVSEQHDKETLREAAER